MPLSVLSSHSAGLSSDLNFPPAELGSVSFHRGYTGATGWSNIDFWVRLPRTQLREGIFGIINAFRRFGYIDPRFR